MKKLFGIVFLCLYVNQAHALFWIFQKIHEATMTEEEKRIEAEEEKKKKKFIGVTFGAGVGDLGLPMLNPRFFKQARDELVGNSLEFALAVEGGWQKYTYEKVGYQAVFRGRFVYMSDFKKPIFSAPIPTKFHDALSIEVSAGIDGIFDFVKNDNSSFGMILGINAGFNLVVPFQPEDDYIKACLNNGYGTLSNLRLGFQVGMPTGFIDLVAEVPFLPVVFMKTPFNYTLSLGYKHFF